MKYFLFITALLFILLPAFIYANVNYIDFNCIQQTAEIKKELNWIYDNQSLFINWSPTWDKEIKKDKVVKKLVNVYEKLVKNTDKGNEKILLMGDIAHYLYNLDQQEYFTKAVDHYLRAWENNPQDYRCPWFLASHYSQSALPESANKYFSKAELFIGDNGQNYEFWEEYAMASYLAGMPSHTMYELDKANKILGKKCKLSESLNDKINEVLITPSADSLYKDEEIWSMTTNDNYYNCVSRPLGISFCFDTTYNISFTHYKNRNSAVIINPPKQVTGYKQGITYTIALMVDVPENGTSINEYITKIAKYISKGKQVIYSGKYGDAIGYELIDPKEYSDQGGGHFIVLGFERKQPHYPGYLIEAPIKIVESEEDKVQYYRLNQRLSRFSDTMYYVFILDTCEKIFKQSNHEFTEFIENNIIIE